MSSVLDLDKFRENKKFERPQLVLIEKCAETGSRPFLALASDEKWYWCKDMRNEHGGEAVVNEVVASIIGQHLEASIPNWKIINVPKTMINQRICGGRPLMGVPVFGSEYVESGELYRFDPRILYVDQDGNTNHYPKLYALWLLCNAEDIQVLFQPSKNMRVWSIDHGFWFGSFEKPWAMGSSEELGGRPQLPYVTDGIDSEHWERAISAVEQLETSICQECIDAIPKEWGFSLDEIARLAKYALNRKAYVVRELCNFRDKKRTR